MYVPKKLFFTKGVGTHREKLTSFELALRDAKIACYNLVRVSSIFPPNCEEISIEEGPEAASARPDRPRRDERERHGRAQPAGRRQRRRGHPSRPQHVRLPLRAPRLRPDRQDRGRLRRGPRRRDARHRPRASSSTPTAPGTRSARSGRSPTSSTRPRKSRRPPSATRTASGPPSSPRRSSCLELKSAATEPSTRRSSMGYLERISQHRIAPPAVTGGETAADLIDHAFLSYNAGRLREVCQVFTRKMLEPDCTVGLTLSGALTPAGLGMSCLIPLIEAGFVDWIVSTGANLYHDTHYALDLPAAPEPAQSRRLRAPAERRHPDLRHRLRLQDAARHRRVLSRADPRRGLRPARWARPSSTTRSAAISTAAPQTLGPARRNSLLAAAFEAGVPIYTSSPGDSSIGMNLAAAQPARRQAPDRHAPRRQRDRRDRLRCQARRRQVGRPDPRRRQPQELHPPDRAADPGSPRPGRERARLLPPDHRRPPRHRRPLGRDGQRGDDLGQGRPRDAARLRDLLHRLHDRPAAPDRLRPGPPRAAPLAAALRSATQPL